MMYPLSWRNLRTPDDVVIDNMQCHNDVTKQKLIKQ